MTTILIDARSVLFVLPFIFCSCVHGIAPGAPTVPTAPSPVDIDITSMQELKAKMIPPPQRPDAPLSRRLSLEEYVNVPPTFRGSPEPIIGPKAKLAILAEEGVKKYVADAMYASALKRDIRTIDRDYVSLNFQELERIGAKGNRAIGYTIARDLARLSRIPGEVQEYDYVIILHGIRDNTETAHSQEINPPATVSPQDWRRYQDAYRNYLSRYDNYWSLVNNYNLTFATTLNDALRAITLDEPKWKEFRRLCDEYSQQYRKYAEEADQNNQNPANKQSCTGPRFRILPILGSKKEEAPPQPLPNKDQIVAEMLKAVGSRSQAPIDATSPATLIASPVNVLREQQSAIAVGTVYQFSISVRIIEMKSTKAVWFGICEAQNLSILNLVAGCADELLARAIKPEGSATVSR